MIETAVSKGAIIVYKLVEAVTTDCLSAFLDQKFILANNRRID